MSINNACDDHLANVGVGAMAGVAGTSLARKVPHRSFCHIHELAGTDDANAIRRSERPRSSRLSSRASGGVRVAHFPASSDQCRFQLYAEYRQRLRQLDLPGTRRVETGQRFWAAAGFQLVLESTLRLKLESGDNSSVAEAYIVLMNVQTREAGTLLAYQVGSPGLAENRLWEVATRHTLSKRMSSAGYYELRTIASLVPHNIGVEVHLLVDRVRIVDPTDSLSVCLASVNCVGRVLP